MFMLEHSVLLRKVLTPCIFFSSSGFCRFDTTWEQFSGPSLTVYYSMLLFIQKMKVFFTNCWNRFLKYIRWLLRYMKL